MNKPFLQQVAEYYIDNHIDLSQYIFVLPNTRSGKFMRMYLRLAARRVTFMPKIVSITYFTQQYCQRPLGDNTELVFVLYQAYNKVLKKHQHKPVDFDSFAFWGNILLNDFNDVDGYLANAHELFKNLRDYTEIQSSYLTEDQKMVIEELLGFKIDMNPEQFWKHMREPSAPDSTKDRYMAFWEVMDDVYNEFNAMLKAMDPPIVYPGLQSKLAYRRISELGADDFDGCRYAFIGFSALSVSRTLMFKHLHDIGVADFFWDTASPYIQAEHSSAGRFVMALSRKLPMPQAFVPDKVDTVANVDIISVPSNVGQAHAAVSIMDEWRGEGAFKDNNLIKTGIVLADPRLLVPMMYALPQSYQPINVTMGFPYSATPFAALLDSIFKMLHRARHDQHETYYMAADVDEVLSHPNVTSLASDSVRAIKDEIAQKHLFYVSTSDLMLFAHPKSESGASFSIDLSFLFQPIKEDASSSQMCAYIDRLITCLRDATEAYCSANGRATDTAYEFVILDAYREQVGKIARLAEKYAIEMRDRSFMSLLRKTLSLGEIPFSGDPVRGLQVMDIMDARLLDFDNIVVLSANERMLPRKNARPSLILASLRYGYGLPTIEDDESSSAYQFFRMIARAERVALIYDARTAGVSSGEMSRYLSQLLYIPMGINLTMRSVKVNPQSSGERVICIDKTPEVMAELDAYKPGGDLNMSASALKTYIQCPLRFYMQYVKRLRLEDPAPEYMDSASLGTVLHNTAEKLYGNKRRVIDVEAIDSMLAQDIHSLIIDEMREEYYHKQNIPGEGQILARIIEKHIRNMLTIEREQVAVVPYTFEAAEYKVGQKVHHWRVTPEHEINFTLSIDRMDSFGDKSLRFIDYKRGSDKLSATTLEALFEDHDCGGIFQVLAYCLAYCELAQDGMSIKPMIYKFSDMMKDHEIADLKIGKTAITDFAIVRDDFTVMFRHLINKILGPDEPFSQTPDSKNCVYCPFVHMCGRYDPNANK